MKILIALLISFPAMAFQNPVRVSEAEKLIRGEPGKTHDCNETEIDCMDYSKVNWNEAKIIDEVVNGDPMYEVNSQSSCETEEECQSKMSELQCDDGFVAKYRMDRPQVFCEKFLGYEQVKTGRKLLVTDPERAEAVRLERETKKAAAQAKADKARAAKEALKNTDLSKIKTIDEIKEVLQKMQDSGALD